MKNRLWVLCVSACATVAAADSISLTNLSGGGVNTPAFGTLTFDDTGDARALASYDVRFLNRVIDELNVENSGYAVDGHVSSTSFARVGGSSYAGGGSDTLAGSLELGFSNASASFGIQSTLVFSEYGGDDEPFQVQVAGYSFMISQASADSEAWLTKTIIGSGLSAYRVYELKLAQSSGFQAFCSGLGIDRLAAFTITDFNGSDNLLSPDINFAAVVVPLPASVWAGLGLMGGVMAIRRLKKVAY